VPFYGIYEVNLGRVQAYHLVDGHYQLLLANGRGHFEIPPLGVELGIWQGTYQDVSLPWLRWWDLQGNLLPTAEERAKEHAQRIEEQTRRVEEQARRVERLAAQLRALGVEPES